MNQFTKQWSARWNGHTIVVENWWKWTLGNGENVFVDGDLVCENRSAWNTFSTILKAPIHDESGTHQLEVHLGSLNGFNIGCHIYVDDELIGGDSKKNLLMLSKSTQALSLDEQRKQLKHELFYRAVVAPLILIPICDMIELYFLNRSLDLLLIVTMLLLINIAQTGYKIFKLPRDNSDQNSTSI